MMHVDSDATVKK